MKNCDTMIAAANTNQRASAGSPMPKRRSPRPDDTTAAGQHAGCVPHLGFQQAQRSQEAAFAVAQPVGPEPAAAHRMQHGAGINLCRGKPDPDEQRKGKHRAHAIEPELERHEAALGQIATASK